MHDGARPRKAPQARPSRQARPRQARPARPDGARIGTASQAWRDTASLCQAGYRATPQAWRDRACPRGGRRGGTWHRRHRRRGGDRWRGPARDGVARRRRLRLAAHGWTRRDAAWAGTAGIAHITAGTRRKTCPGGRRRTGLRPAGIPSLTAVTSPGQTRPRRHRTSGRQHLA